MEEPQAVMVKVKAIAKPKKIGVGFMSDYGTRTAGLQLVK